MSDRVIREPFPSCLSRSLFKETYGGAEDIVMVFCTLIRTASHRRPVLSPCIRSAVRGGYR